ncbi:LysE family translocator [Rhodococcus tukisamuensis]|uniref:Threonine/homoserine/homoserine lactone efflux protein n=1 Tax=Rhodococcus tukisamuensis TaxID=168276 RepID=A0A1G6T1E5_9NOCA|nr:LysE family translocator [Rhodococcus tukisamuensis]SDD22684.1 Threonine/homoserine/homoserine lactone efflux protein [Rhodococcus tukisamuensis]
MVTAAAMAGVALVALTMVLTPGPNMIYLASRSISQGRRAGMMSLGGVAVGFLAYLTAASLGLTAVFFAVPALFVVIKTAGAAYLGYLAWRMLRPGGRSAFEVSNLERHSSFRLFGMGFVTNILNPKIALMYVALIPQFVDPSRGPVWQQSLLLGTIQILVAVAVNAMIVLASSSISSFLTRRPVWLSIQKWLAGGILGVFAVRMALD